ncbi:hypothetical protein BC938DRAFT_480499 [Jimgerdemannia flammicorona]|uniref:VPS37 C-terminal domain-containing protein n=1 Tax=Jimgerdemannia flammicorona TaxID=994334 RepID=A0A433QIE4_9FUNG|nr:hypothetical protein BC938DRAFT_480499 [Jimgerdemannia flammicorona]
MTRGDVVTMTSLGMTAYFFSLCPGTPTYLGQEECGTERPQANHPSTSRQQCSRNCKSAFACSDSCWECRIGAQTDNHRDPRCKNQQSGFVWQVSLASLIILETKLLSQVATDLRLIIYSFFIRTAPSSKRKQITSLYNYNISVRELSKDSQFEIPCPLPSGWTICLIVNLPPNFPEASPVITVSPAATHPWLETNVVVGHDKLKPNAWGAHASLGKLVKEIRDEFTARMPVRGGSSAGMENGLVGTTAQSTKPPPPIPSESHSAVTPKNQLVSMECPAIMGMSAEELEELLADDYAFTRFFDELEQISSHTSSCPQDKNLSKEAELNKLQETATQLNDEHRELRSEFDEKILLQQEALKRFAPSALLSRLRSAVYESDELSESIVQSFLDGKLDQDVFVRQFRELRKVYHLRASKLERAERSGILNS